MKHTRQVSRIKFVLIALAALGTYMLFSEAKVDRYVSEDVVTEESVSGSENTQVAALASSKKDQVKKKIDQAVEEVASVTMQGPKYSGRDEQGRHWKISAASARQVGEGYQQIELQSFNAEAQTAQKRSVSFGANYGFYDAENKKVILKESVNALYEGYELVTEVAHYYLKTSEAVIDAPLVIKGPKGQMKANHFQMINGGQKMTFTGNVEVVFYPNQKGQ